MYTEFKATDYPLRPYKAFTTGLSDPQAAALKAGLIDIRFNVYAAALPYLLVGQLMACTTTATTLTLKFNLVGSTQIRTGQGQQLTIKYNPALKLSLTFNKTAAYATEPYIRAYFDLTDCTEVAAFITAMDGYICLDNLAELWAAFEANGGVPVIGNTGGLAAGPVCLEPTTVAVIGSHRVDYFVCDYAKPLLLHAPATDNYSVQSEPVTGAVTLLQGANCSITLQEYSNTVIIAAVKGNNGTVVEKCGKWGDRLPTVKDVLCTDAVYSLAGASPDDTGALEIKGQYPLTVGAYSYSKLPEAFKTQGLAGAYPHIAKFIVIGLNNSALDANCPPVPDLCQ